MASVLPVGYQCHQLAVHIYGDDQSGCDVGSRAGVAGAEKVGAEDG